MHGLEKGQFIILSLRICLSNGGQNTRLVMKLGEGHAATNKVYKSCREFSVNLKFRFQLKLNSEEHIRIATLYTRPLCLFIIDLSQNKVLQITN